ncbi:MAG: aldehyde ferredoxin oxidoreductase family protein [Eubacteriales bacterium]
MVLPGGYWGRYLRVDLNTMKVYRESLDDESVLRQCVGGSGIGGKLVYEGVPGATPWDGENNRVAIFSGPLAGGPVSGTGTFSAVFKGPMTNLAGNTQANGFLGAYLKFNGYDGIVIDGKATAWTILVVDGGEARLLSGEEYLGLDTIALEEAAVSRLGLRNASVFGIGPAGENRVRFAGLIGDRGHAAARNGIGAVLGAKKLKAIVVSRGNMLPEYCDRKQLVFVAREMLHYARTFDGGARSTWGTASGVANLHKSGQLPVRNYTTSLWPHYEKFTGRYLRENFRHRVKPCWGCTLHCRHMVVTKGPYAGLEAEEPEYEALAAFGPQIGNSDPGGAVMLNDLADRLGMDVNETGWIIGWAMECVEKGILKPAEMDGIDLKWGDVEASAKLMRQIAFRRGFGDVLAEGVMRAAKVVGRGAEDLGVYTLKGSTPRGHDHRGRWEELLDTCLGNTGTVESTGGIIDVRQHGITPVKNRFSPEEVSTLNAKVNGRRMFEDCVSICRFASEKFSLLVQAVNAATGWDMDEQEAMDVGRRFINRLRVFNLKQGLRPETEYPSARYGSVPADGPAAGTGIIPVFEQMRSNYWRHMGWSETEGRPLPETLSALNLEHLIADAWPESR